MSLPSLQITSAPSYALHQTQTCLQHLSTVLLLQSVFLRPSSETGDTKCSPPLTMLASMLFLHFSYSYLWDIFYGFYVQYTFVALLHLHFYLISPNAKEIIYYVSVPKKTQIHSRYNFWHIAKNILLTLSLFAYMQALWTEIV